MKTYLKAWWRGIGVLGLYIMLSVIQYGFGLLLDTFPESFQWPVGIVLLFIVPPILFWTVRSVYPEVDPAKRQSSANQRTA